MTMHRAIIFVFPILFSALTVYAAFTQTACDQDDEIGCVQRNANGTWCYYPIYSPTQTACSGSSFSTTNSEYQGVLNVHIAQGLSVAYYGGDLTILGGADYSLPAGAGIVYLCASGEIGVGQFETVCMTATKDNSIATDGFDFCAVGIPQQSVTDGCYNPNSFVQSNGTSEITSCNQFDNFSLSLSLATSIVPGASNPTATSHPATGTVALTASIISCTQSISTGTPASSSNTPLLAGGISGGALVLILIIVYLFWTCRISNQNLGWSFWFIIRTWYEHKKQQRPICAFMRHRCAFHVIPAARHDHGA
jgi:hypothetical protein